MISADFGKQPAKVALTIRFYCPYCETKVTAFTNGTKVLKVDNEGALIQEVYYAVTCPKCGQYVVKNLEPSYG